LAEWFLGRRVSMFGFGSKEENKMKEFDREVKTDDEIESITALYLRGEISYKDYLNKIEEHEQRIDLRRIAHKLR
jgi:hypothetical protein